MKAQIKSQTIKNLIIMVLPILFLISRAFGLEIAPAEQTNFMDHLLALIDGIANIVAIIVWLVTWIGAYVGRLKTKEPLGGFFKV